MTDQLEKLFADLRVETIAEVRPPGVAAARRAVGRRKAVRSIASGAAVLAVVAGSAVGFSSFADTHRTAGAPADDRGWPELARGAADRIGLGLQPQTLGAVIKDGLPSVLSVVGGDYDAKIACAGVGKVTVRMVTSAVGGDTSIHDLVVQCGDHGEMTTARLRVPSPDGKVVSTYVADATAAGHTAVAYRLDLADSDRSRLLATARSALGTTAQGTSLLDSPYRKRDATVGPGRYRIWIACTGQGTVDAVVSLAGDPLTGKAGQLVRTTVRCGTTTVTGSATFTVPDGAAGGVDVVLTPDTVATGQAATAIQVERL